jgi:glycosyltransferase involved in cell wall biosynthesis
MSRLLVLSPEPVRARMAGMGIRACEVARHLRGAGHDATLVAPGDPREAPEWLCARGVAVERLESGTIGPLAARHDAAVVSGHVSNDLFRSAEPLPTLVDLYDPFLVENLSYAARLGPGVFRHDHATLSLQLERGDRFLVSSPLQRAFYAGFLLAIGRLNPETWADDPSLARLLAVAPFGVPDEPPASGPPLLRTAANGIGPDDPVLFFGGVYDWYDPAALLEVFGRVLERVPACRLVFVSSPNPETTPQGAYARAEEVARARGWHGRHVVFVPWFPYEARGSVYLEATAAVLTHRPGLETDLSLRTRGLDFLWAGLPLVSHRGGAMGQLLADSGAGLLVAPGDEEGLADALARVLTDDALRTDLSTRGRAAAAAFRWEATLAPVLDFAAAPSCDPLKPKARAHGAEATRGLGARIAGVLSGRRRP